MTTAEDGGTDENGAGDGGDDDTDDGVESTGDGAQGDGSGGDEGQQDVDIDGSNVADGASSDGGGSYGDGSVAIDDSSGDEIQTSVGDNQEDVDVISDPPPPPTGGPSLADIERVKSSLVREDGPPEIDPDGGSFANIGTAGWDPGADGDGPAPLGDIYSALRATQPGDSGAEDLGFGEGADLEPAGLLAAEPPQDFGVGDSGVTKDLGRFDGEPDAGLQPIEGPAFKFEPVAVDDRGFDEPDDAPLLSRLEPKASEDTGPDRDPAFDVG